MGWAWAAVLAMAKDRRKWIVFLMLYKVGLNSVDFMDAFVGSLAVRRRLAGIFVA